jgi:hypothetical protein
MAWKSSGTSISNKHWSYDSLHNGLTRKNVEPGVTHSLWYNTTAKYFSSEKNYLFKFDVNNFGQPTNATTYAYKYLISETPWGDRFTHSWSATERISTLPRVLTQTTLNLYSSPLISTSYTDVAYFKSTYNGFGTVSGVSTLASVIKSIDVIEFDWFIQGWAWSTTSDQYMGWRYDDSNNSFEYNHYQSSLNSRRLPANGHTQSNYISKYISFDFYNLSFNFVTTDTSLGYIDLYLTEDLPSTSTTLSTFNASLLSSVTSPTNQYLGRISATQASANTNYQFYNLSGNKYLTAVANFSGTVSTYKMNVTDIIIQGGYQETDNNEQFLFTNSDIYEEPTPLEVIGGSTDATYSTVTTTPQTLHDPAVGNNFGATGYPGFFSTVYGQITNLSQLYSKVGNGTFRSGVWENGVWNSGWRVDDQIYDFNDIVGAFSTETRNTRWRVLITGATSSAAQFEIGDKVSIGNIVSININEERKLLKNYFTIINKNETDIVVEFDNSFPIRRIIKDSENHKIRITKNVWLNGGFLNGYFEGIWNNGLFKGYPLITEMDNTHWIDGIFDGGRFKSRTISYNFADTYYQNGYVGLSFSSPHGFLIGDLIFIDKDDSTINPQYNGDATVTSIVDDYLVVIDKTWGSNSTLESGLVTRRTKTALIQNFKFKDNNVASKTSRTSTVLKDIWKFNSWIDVNFLTQSTTNIGKDRVLFNSSPTNIGEFFNEKYGLGEYTQMNLYGYITDDVLSSESAFRDIDSMTRRKYKLGTKYEVYNDFLGDKSQFNRPFGHATASGGLGNFFADGWTYSFSGTFSSDPIPSAFTFSRTIDGTLDILFADKSLSAFVLDNTNLTIENRRYSIVEFDLLDYTIPEYFTTGGTLSGNLFDYSPITFFNFPFISDNNGWTNKPGFPIQQNVDYRRTGSTTKREYFYNKLSLDMGYLGISYFTLFSEVKLTGINLEVDNIKFLEVDSIPFFQYTTEDYVNKSVQVPYQGSAPFIDYNNVNFSFVDNIVISLDSIQVSPSNTTFVPSTTIGGGTTLYATPTTER